MADRCRVFPRSGAALVFSGGDDQGEVLPNHSDELGAEMAAAVAALIPSDIAILRHYSVPDAMIAMGMIGAVQAENLAGGLLWAPEGHPRLFVTPARGWEVETDTPMVETFWGEIVDLIAWRPDEPGLLSRTGMAECLGHIAPQYLDPEPVPVRRGVAAWLRGRCRGIVPLGLPADQQRLLLGCGGVAGEDIEHAMELRRLLERPYHTPRIMAEGAGDGKAEAGAVDLRPMPDEFQDRQARSF